MPFRDAAFHNRSLILSKVLTANVEENVTVIISNWQMSMLENENHQKRIAFFVVSRFFYLPGEKLPTPNAAMRAHVRVSLRCSRAVSPHFGKIKPIFSVTYRLVCANNVGANKNSYDALISSLCDGIFVSLRWL